MTERIDHAAEALDYVNAVESVAMNQHLATRALAAAQVHATLALVEQQRIANLITLWMGDSAILVSDARFDQVGEDVREALGL